MERVHPEQLERHHLPAHARKDIWNKRFRQINNFEQYLVENGIHLLKFFLHISPEEQRSRLLERIENPETRWRFSTDDVEERGHWDEYMGVYEDALTHTNTEHAPWYILPADRRWFVRAAVASVIATKLRSLHSEYPSLSDQQSEQIKQARETLER